MLPNDMWMATQRLYVHKYIFYNRHFARICVMRMEIVWHLHTEKLPAADTNKNREILRKPFSANVECSRRISKTPAEAVYRRQCTRQRSIVFMLTRASFLVVRKSTISIVSVDGIVYSSRCTCSAFRDDCLGGLCWKCLKWADNCGCMEHCLFACH